MWNAFLKVCPWRPFKSISGPGKSNFAGKLIPEMRPRNPAPTVIVAQITKFMGPTWGPPGSCRSQMGPMLAPWTLLSGRLIVFSSAAGTFKTRFCREILNDFSDSWQASSVALVTLSLKCIGASDCLMCYGYPFVIYIFWNLYSDTQV